MRINKDLERIFLRDREDLARMVGYLLGCHAGHSFYVNADTFSVDVYPSMLACADNSGVGWVFSIDNMSTVKRHAPPRPRF